MTQLVLVVAIVLHVSTSAFLADALAPERPVSAVGFTGSRSGVTSIQSTEIAARLYVALVDGGYTEFHHGDCVGADATAAGHAYRVGFYVVSHPPIDWSYRAWFPADHELAARPYLDRNRDIVDACALLLACPDGPERLRSGTWSTIRYARRTGREVVVVMPDGSVTG